MKLYDAVVKNMNGNEQLLTSEQCSKISMMDGEAAENIFLLMLHHFVITNEITSPDFLETKDTFYKFKYATKDKKGIKFMLSNLPEELQKIIYSYLQQIS